jgi:hypothetical protein
MAKVIFYPLGNADCCLMHLNNEMMFVFDYADMHDPEDRADKRLPLAKHFKEDIGWPKRKYVDVLAFTHGDNDHVKQASELFWLNHAVKYQGEDRVKFKQMWVPAALIVEEGSEDDTRVIRAEARHRFINKEGILVFARPEHLKDWLESQGKNLADYQDLIVDAGKLIPGYTLEAQGVEFFVHSPFAKRVDDGVLDRNDNCLVMQATLKMGNRLTRFLITADSTWDCWEDMVNATRRHGNNQRLAWDIFKIPHHCSYLSMSEEKGDRITKPIAQFEWLLEQGAQRATMISSSWPIPSTTEDQPPHVETYRRYKETAESLDADLIVTMEHPSESSPHRAVITIDENGPTLKRTITSASIAVTSTRSPRVG